MEYVAFILFLINFPFALFAQNKIAVVLSDKGKPLADALVKNSKISVLTNSNGEFDLSVFALQDTLTVSHVGFTAEKITVTELQKTMKIILTPRTYETATVKVEDERQLKQTSINIDVKERAKFRQTSQILQAETPLFVKDYGGYAGLKTVSFRGMSSENTLVLFNEARVNDMRSGAFDFATVGINSIDKIDFSESGIGGYVSSGGAINLISGIPNKQNNLILSADFSNLNSKNFALKSDYNFGRLSASVNLERSFSPNEFPFKFENQTLRRANADYSKTFFGGSLIYLAKNIYAKLYAHYSALESGLPGFVVTNNAASSLARNETKSFLSVANIVWNFADNLTFKNVTSFSDEKFIITDPSKELLVTREREEANLNGINFNNTLIYNGNNIDAEAGAYFSYDELASISPAFLGDEPYSSNRFTQNYFANARYLFGDITTIKSVTLGGTVSWMFFSENINEDYSFNDYLSANVYAEFSAFSERIKFRVNYSHSYRAPTFTELYYSVIFSPNKINAERYDEISFSAYYEADAFSARASVFKIYGKNKIVWTPTRLALQIPQNVKAVNSLGGELMIKTQPVFFNSVSFSLIYSYTAAKNVSAKSPDDASYDKYLVYSPLHQLKAQAEYAKNGFRASLNYVMVSERFYTSDNNPRYVLPLYNIFDLSLGYDFNLSGVKNGITLNVYNLFDEAYFIIQSYPMPLRTASINYTLEFR